MRLIYTIERYMMDGDVVLFNRFDYLITYEAGVYDRALYDGWGCCPIQQV
jgi:hypothetical protein